MEKGGRARLVGGWRRGRKRRERREPWESFGDLVAESHLSLVASLADVLPFLPNELMAQTASMGPPLSPRETRRSGRRSAPSHSHSHSNSTSTSPDSAPDTPTANTHNTNGNGAMNHNSSSHSRPALSSNNNSSRNKRSHKRDGTDDTALDEHHKNGSNANAPQNGRSKRKGKEKEKVVIQEPQVELVSPQIETPVNIAMDLVDAPPEEDSVTRCICGSTGASHHFFIFSRLLLIFFSVFLFFFTLDVRSGANGEDEAEGEFMVQCEICNVWQHGPCMGYDAEEDLVNRDYYCELCRPDLHQDLLKYVITLHHLLFHPCLHPQPPRPDRRAIHFFYDIDRATITHQLDPSPPLFQETR